MTNTSLESHERGDAQVVAGVSGADGKEQQLTAELILVGIGWQAKNKRGIGLEELGVEMDQRGFIKVSGMMQTNVDGVYAIGDCTTSTPWLAHKASAEGILVAELIAGHHPPAIDYGKIVGCYYCNPEVASVGLSEAKARERGYDVKVGKFPFSANGKASILGQRNGFIKIVVDKKYAEVLVIHSIRPHATT